MPKSYQLTTKKIGDDFYYNFWKKLNVNDMVEIKKEFFVLACKVLERCGTDRYKLRVMFKRYL